MAFNPRKRDRMLVVERIVAELTDHDGRFDLTDAATQLAAEYRANPDLLDPEAQAQHDVDSMDRSHRPNPSAPSLFDKDAWLPLGLGQRVQMGRAQRYDLDAWGLVLTREHADQVNAYATKMGYIATRREAWTDGDTCLLDVEQRFDA